MPDLTELTCAECLVDPCGRHLPINGDGCRVIPDSAVIPNGDGTATWARVDGDGGFRTALLIGPDPSGSAAHVLRGNGYAPENNADLLLDDNVAAVSDLTSFLPSSPSTTVSRQVGTWTFTNTTGDERIYQMTAGMLQAVQITGSGAAVFDFFHGLKSTISSTTKDGGMAGEGYAGTPGAGNFIKSRDQVHATAVVPSGGTVDFTAWVTLVYTTLTASAWSATVNNVRCLSLNHTGAV